MKFHDFLIKNGKRTLSRARMPRTSPNHCNYKQIHRSRRGAIRPEITKTMPNNSHRTFWLFSPGVIKVDGFLNFRVNLAKRGPLGGPAPRSLFFLRNIKVSEPPEYRKMVRNWYFLKISWDFTNFDKFHELYELSWNFHEKWKTNPCARPGAQKLPKPLKYKANS